MAEDWLNQEIKETRCIKKMIDQIEERLIVDKKTSGTLDLYSLCKKEQPLNIQNLSKKITWKFPLRYGENKQAELVHDSWSSNLCFVFLDPQMNYTYNLKVTPSS